MSEQGNKKPAYVLGHILKLRDPFEIGDTEYTELVFKHRLLARHIEDIPVDVTLQTMKSFFKPIRCMVGVPSVVIEQLSPADLTECMKVFTYFFTGGQEDGETLDGLL